ncbi:MAG: superoxide dismutase family protein [Calditrichaeota bacterium]|nr:MAG: superoxide dismutase family protein [Calditrichota bacterium]
MKSGVLRSSVLLLSAVLLALSGCAQPANQPPQQPEVTRAIAVLHPTEGNSVTGVVTFTKVEGGIKIVADVEGLTPGKHGFHIHQWGDCSAANGTSAGGHFNPDNVPHAGPDSPKRHVGDLGNLEADENGKAHYERVDTVIAFSGKHSIIGRGVIVHAGEDDLKSQPTGAAGARVACGVIGIANPK